MRALLGRLCTKLGPETLDRYAHFLESALDEFGIGTLQRRAWFLAQLLHESAGFTRWEENLNYSAEGLLKTWPKRFDAASAQRYARNPESIANRVYANRMGNGSEGTGDGWRYRGRGPGMLTGRDLYRSVGKRLGLDLQALPDQVATPAVGFAAAAVVWDQKDLNEAPDFEAVCQRWNGGTIGLEDRKKWLGRIEANLNLV